MGAVYLVNLLFLCSFSVINQIPRDIKEQKPNSPFFSCAKSVCSVSESSDGSDLKRCDSPMWESDSS